MNVRLVSDSFLFEHITLTADDAEKDDARRVTQRCYCGGSCRLVCVHGGAGNRRLNSPATRRDARPSKLEP